MTTFLTSGDDAAWTRFHEHYERTVARRFADDRAPFDALASLARRSDVFLGCSCPTARQPHPERCHTALALAFMKARFPDLVVQDVVR